MNYYNYIFYRYALSSVISSSTVFNPLWRKQTEASYAPLPSASDMSSVFQHYTNLFRPDIIHNIPNEQIFIMRYEYIPGDGQQYLQSHKNVRINLSLAGEQIEQYSHWGYKSKQKYADK